MNTDNSERRVHRYILFALLARAFFEVIMQLNKLVENSYESAYRKMIKDTEMQDAQEEWIDKRADELMGNFNNENDW
ncbi:hypothetical protein [Gilliamella sp. wkB171]|uniref:hypothetical protein n=1 Tax=Gilliamella sp. wkB171 TaxID=3120258 RepID=UPI00081345A4|nr:hypothetical protein [Gilliamella apicola]OCL17811.1 hypothetical protein A9G03_10420 [Gilliamella apicola]